MFETRQRSKFKRKKEMPLPILHFTRLLFGGVTLHLIYFHKAFLRLVLLCALLFAHGSCCSQKDKKDSFGAGLLSSNRTPLLKSLCSRSVIFKCQCHLTSAPAVQPTSRELGTVTTGSCRCGDLKITFLCHKCE